MSDVTPRNPGPSQGAEAIARIILQAQAALATGNDVADAAIIAEHPELSPELASELKKLRQIQGARAAAELAATTAAPRILNAPDSTVEQTLRYAVERSRIQANGYTIVQELSRGGQGVVFLAIQQSTNRKVVLKVMREGPLADERAMARFEREVQALAALNHPNIVTIFDTGSTTDGSRYIAMKYIAGCSLDEFMQQWHRKQPSDPSKLLRIFLKICAAVNVAHNAGIIHRDLKPNNIRIDERGEPQILDFGLARIPADGENRAAVGPISITGEFLGSLPWSSPEQAEGNLERIDGRTDVYSLGVILYQMLTGGRFPYEVVGNMRDVLNNIITAEPTPPSKLLASGDVGEEAVNRKIDVQTSPVVNEAMERIVLKALAKRRSQRYQTAGELGRDIANYLAGKNAEKAGRSAPVAVARPPLKKELPVSRLALFATVVAAAVIVVGTLAAFISRRDAGLKAPVASTSPAESFGRVELKELGGQGRPVATPLAATTDPAQSAVTIAAPDANAATTPTIVSAVNSPTAVGIPADAAIYFGHHIKLIQSSVPWTEAEQRCVQMGGHLACPETIDKLNAIEAIKGDDLTAWLGGSADATGVWTWLDGKPINVSLFQSARQPDGYHWLFMTRVGKLAGRPEDGNVAGASIPMVQAYICEWDQ